MSGAPSTVEGQPLLSPPAAAPIRVWAAIGAGFLALTAYIYISWIAGGPQETPDGATPIPSWMTAVARIFEVSSTVGIIACLYLFVVKPWRQTRRLSTDGMFCLAMLSLSWQDTLPNLFVPW